MGKRLLVDVACRRASARSACKAGSGPPAFHAPPGGNSRRDAAKARHVTTQAALAAARGEAGTFATRARASKPTKVVVWVAHLPPTAACPPKLGIRLASVAAGAWATTMLAWTSASSRGWLSRPKGSTSVASTAGCSPCLKRNPLQTTSRASCTGTSKFMSASRTFLCTWPNIVWNISKHRHKPKNGRGPNFFQSATAYRPKTWISFILPWLHQADNPTVFFQPTPGCVIAKTDLYIEVGNSLSENAAFQSGPEYAHWHIALKQHCLCGTWLFWVVSGPGKTYLFVNHGSQDMNLWSAVVKQPQTVPEFAFTLDAGNGCNKK